MKDQDFALRLQQELPDVPEGFHDRMTRTLNGFVVQERCEKAAAPARRTRLNLAFALAAALLLLAAAAAAALHWNLFDEIFGATPKNADQVLTSVVHQETINNVEITVDEAGYDGITLYLRWRYRMPDVDTPLGMYRDGQTGDGLSEEDYQLLNEHGVGWWIDNLWINGQCIGMGANSGGSERGSETPGEIIVSSYYRLDNEDVYLPDGDLTISLPIGQRQPLEDYSLANHPEKYDENGNLKLPEKGMVTFTIPNSIRSRVTTEQPMVWTQLPDVRACVSKVVYSPIMMYVTLQMECSPDSLARYIQENGEGYYDENGTLLFPYSGMDLYGDWASSLTLVDGQGQPVFPNLYDDYGYVYGNNGYGSEWAEYLFPYLDSYPAEMWLAPMQDGTADMSRALRVR